MTNKTRIYLDVDGVLNADLAGSPQHWGYSQTGIATAEGSDYKIVWAPELISELEALGVEIVWATTWRDHARDSLSQTLGGFGSDFRVMHPNRDENAPLEWPSINWKIRSIFAEQSEDSTPFIHIDDEIAFTPKWKAMVGALGGLAISPHPKYGITRKHVQQIKDYIAKQQFNQSHESEGD